MLLALEPDETLLILKIAFLVLLYLFIVIVVRSATKDLGGSPQESIILGAAEAEALRREHGVVGAARLVVIASPELKQGETIEILAPTVVGRDAGSGIRLTHDEFASARHARIEPRPDGAWVDDLGSTNGTFVNGDKVKRGRLARAGDVVRIGETELQVQR